LLSYLSVLQIGDRVNCEVSQECDSFAIDFLDGNRFCAIEELLKPLFRKALDKFCDKLVSCAHDVLVLFGGAAAPDERDVLLGEGGCILGKEEEDAVAPLDQF